MKISLKPSLWARCSCLVFAATFAVAAETVSEAQLQQACTALLQAPQAAQELQVLLDVSRHATNSPALRSRAMAAYALTLLMQGNTNAYERAFQVIQTTYPETAPLMTVGSRDCFIACTDCAGSGTQTTICPVCMGSGKCKSCAGSGKKDAEVCPACKGKGLCARCAGVKKIEIACPTCRGSRFTFKPSEKILANFSALLTNIVDICQDNARFAEQSALAAKEKDNAKRIELFTKLLNDFPHRADLADAQQRLALAVAQRDKREAQLQKQKAQEQAEREVEELRRLRDAADQDAAIAKLTTYLKDHPRSAAQMELQALCDELIAARDRKVLTRKILYGVAALLGVLFVLSCLAPLVFRKKTARLSPLPGMDKLDKTAFIDPLSLNAQDSRQREKTKTAEIPRTED